MRGRITRIKREKGFGFIRGEDGQDRFFHADGLVVDVPRGATPGDVRASVRAAFAALPEGDILHGRGTEVEFDPVVEPGRPAGKNQRADRIRVV